MRFVVIGFLFVGCTNAAQPAPTDTVCPDPDPGTLTWENFGQKFMADDCTMCHASTSLVRSATVRRSRTTTTA